LEKLPELLILLEEEKQEWDQLCRAIIIPDIQKFAIGIQDLGIQFHYPPLKKWGESLYTQASRFDHSA